MRLDGRTTPTLLEVVVGLSCFAMQLWWEAPPWISQVVPSSGSNGLEVRVKLHESAIFVSAEEDKGQPYGGWREGKGLVMTRS